MINILNGSGFQPENGLQPDRLLFMTEKTQGGQNMTHVGRKKAIWGFLLLALIMFDIIGIIVLNGIASDEPFHMLLNYSQTDAVITNISTQRIKKYRNGTRSNHHHSKEYYVTRYNATIKFETADGNTISKELISVGPGYSKGAYMSIYYDPGKPEKVIKDSQYEMVRNGMLVLILFNVIGIVALIVIIVRKSKGSVYKISRVDRDIESRYKSYEEYGGEKTERAGTLFDREVKDSDLKL